MLELNELMGDIARHALAVAGSLLGNLHALFSAGMPNSLDPGALAVGSAAAGAAGAAAATGGGGGDRGFRYAGLPNVVRDSPTDDGDPVDSYPGGTRLRYDGVIRDANGTVTHYHVNNSGRAPGYIPAGETFATPPVPPPRPSIILDPSLFDRYQGRAAQASAGRG